MKTYQQFINEALRQITIGPSPSPFGRQRQQRDNLERAAFRRAGVRRSRASTSSSRRPNAIRFNSIPSQSKNTSTTISSYPNQASYAKDVLPDKVDPKTNKVQTTQNRVLFLRRLKTKHHLGGRTDRKVHAVDILPRTNTSKNDPGFVTRGREFHQDVETIPDKVKSVGGNPGDVIVGKAAEPIPGSKNPKKGRKVRERLYTNKLDATKRDPITNIQSARVK